MLTLLFALLSFPYSQSKEWSPGCESWPRSLPSEHSDRACNKPIQNSHLSPYWQRNFDRPEIILGLPEEKTWLCPVENVLTTEDIPSIGGHETRWIVHNAASTPVVLSWINQEGIEMSAADAKTHPPEADARLWPDGPILMPGNMAVVNSFQGHTFLARELLEDASGKGENKAGRVLLKRRTGLIYVQNDRGASCPKDALDNDPVPSEVETKSKIRSPVNANPECNFLDKGFINQVGCGIDIYFATGGNYTLTPLSFPKGQDPPHCERFSAHLGVNTRPTNYLRDYSSPVKFEVTYATHRFIARMSHDNSLVAEIVIENDIIYDCPDLGITAPIVSIETKHGLDIRTGGSFAINKNVISHDHDHLVNTTEVASIGVLLTKGGRDIYMMVKPASQK